MNQYLLATQISKQHLDELKWINRYNGKFKDDLIKIHLNKLKILKERQKPNELQQAKSRTTKTKSQIQYGTASIFYVSKIHLTQTTFTDLARKLKIRSNS